LRVVIDTNVFVSSFFGGNPKEIIDLWRDGRLVLCLSGSIIDEYVRVLSHMGLGEEKELSELLALFSKSVNILFTAKPKKVRAVEKDPSDDKFLECALTLDAKYIISGDKALLDLESYGKVEIVNPRRFLEVWGSP